MSQATVDNGKRVETSAGLRVGVTRTRDGLVAAYRSPAPVAPLELELDGERYRATGEAVRSDLPGIWTVRLEKAL